MSQRRQSGAGKAGHSDSDVDSLSDGEYSANPSSSEEDDELEGETHQQVRARLAREYLDSVKMDVRRKRRRKRKKGAGSDSDGGDDSDDSSDESDDELSENGAISKSLNIRALKARNQFMERLADGISERLKGSPSPEARYYTGYKATPTAVDLSEDSSFAASCDKLGTVVTWNIETGARTYLSSKVTDRSSSVPQALSCSIAPDGGKTVLVGMSDGRSVVYDLRSKEVVERLSGHKGKVVSVAHAPVPPYNCFTASEDRCVRSYTPQMQYIETLYGHQSHVTSLACLPSGKPVTVSRDRTVRVWDIANGTHGIYRAGSEGGGADCVCPLGDKKIVTGSDDGCVRLWELGKKKPVDTVENAHSGKWVVSCCGVKPGFSDVCMSGSWDGKLRFYGLLEAGEDGRKKAELWDVGSVEIDGFLNGLAMDKRGRFAVVAIGREHRLGRWEVCKGVKERLCVLPLLDAAKDDSDISENGDISESSEMSS